MKTAWIFYILAWNCTAQESTTVESAFTTSGEKELGESCDADEQCLNLHSHCDASSNTCQCNRDFYQSSGNCFKRILLQGYCSLESSTNQCVENASCVSTTVPARCECDPQFYMFNNTCITGIPPLGYCNQTSLNQCVRGASCVYNSTRSSSLCRCNTQFYMRNNMCFPEIMPGNVCAPLDQCIENAYCVNDSSGISKCRCHKSFFFLKDKCIARVKLGRPCYGYSADECVDNASCVKNNWNSITVCQCDEDFFKSQDICVSLSNLMPRHLTVSAVGAFHINIKWGSPEVTGFRFEYKIRSSVSSEPVTIPWASFSVQGLFPGSWYNISVKTVIYSDQLPKESPPVVISQQTRPDKANITQIVDSVPMTFKFVWTIDGYVDSFSGYLCKYINSQPLDCKTFTTKNTSVVFENLQGNTTYWFNITARAGSLTGESTNVIKRTKVSAASSVSNLQMVDVEATSFAVKFTHPGVLVEKVRAFELAINNTAQNSSHCVILRLNGTVCKKDPAIWKNCEQTWDFSVVNSTILYSGFVDAAPDCVYAVTAWTWICYNGYHRSSPAVIHTRTHNADNSVDPSAVWAIFHSNQCSTTGSLKAMVCAVLYGKVHIKDPLLLIENSSLCGSRGFPLVFCVPVPNIVTSIDVTNTVPVLNDSEGVSVEITWLPPQPRPGYTNYTVQVWDAVNNISSHNGCTNHGYENTSCLIEHLLSFWEYSFVIFAETSAGKSFVSVSDLVVTSELGPGLVKVLKVSKNPNSYRLCRLILKDPVPEERKNFITGYKIIIVCNTSTHNYIESSFAQISNLTDTDYRRINSSIYKFDFSVIPGSYYKLWLYTVGRDNKTSEAMSVNYHAPVGPPPAWMGGPVAGFAMETTLTSFALEFNNAAFFHNNSNGEIQLRGLIVSNFEWMSSSTSLDFYGSSLHIHSWLDAQRNMSENLPYFYKIGLEELEDQQYGKLYIEIGRDGNCDSTTRMYCNGNLQPGTTYYVRGFVCSKAGCTLSPLAGPYKTTVDEASSGGVYAGIFIPLILFIIIVILAPLGYWIKKRKTRVINKGSTRLSLVQFNPPKWSRNRPVKLSELKSKVVEMHKDSDLRFSMEYADLTILSPEHPSNASQLDENKQKNRFTNVIPFDHSRVLLTQIDEEESSDYINASYIEGYNREQEYIAAQGPLPATVDDFWRMIWEQNIAIIVMVTPLKEAGKIKCEQYWPSDVSDPRQYGEVIVENTSSSTVNTYNLSVFSVKHTQHADEVHTVYHFHFLNWRDMTADLEAHNLLDFVKTVRSYVRGDMKGPILVHCSAGVGRTGTFITIDYLTQFIKEHDLEDEVDIFAFILKMRDQRLIMVQAEAQYTFIHDAAVELLEEKQNTLELSHNEADRNSCADPLYMNVTALSASPPTKYLNVDETALSTSPTTKYLNVDETASPQNTSISTADSSSSEEDDNVIADSYMSSSTTKLLTTEL